MTASSRFWADLTTREFAGLDPASTVAVLPVAATEQHGPHLPLSVDQSIVDGVIAAALPRLPAALPVLFLPTQAVGYSPEHSAFAGTLTLSSATLAAVWTELGECVARAGLKKLLLLNAHGGQVSVMDIVARELRVRCGLIVYSCSWWNLPLGQANAQFSAQEQRFGVHAGEIETSMLLALRPQHVAMDQAQDFPSSSQERAGRYPILGNGSSAKLGWAMQDYNAQGAAGNAAAATADKGRMLLDTAGAQLALLLQELSSLPLATLVDKPAA
ncbi:creatininase family protein [uncultured Ramlibacter sp.]|uniref:creatininase family protein n=1 Tax=uncultured Ramlibacter sp. TaxID=260755 RepID=UPI002625EC1A|nr:creatininase family protein [uncultured Ramlibacter sp.]